MSTIPISIDLTELREEFDLVQSQVEGLGSTLVNVITDRIFSNWRDAAMKGLNKTRKSYINGLNIGEVTPTHKYIQLTGTFPNMIEEGFGAFDMKPKMLASKKAKVSPNGVKFITIPFRHAAAGSIGESEVFSNVMPKEISDVVQKMTPTKTSISGSKTSGGRLGFSDIPKQYQIPKSREAVSNIKTQESFPKYTHTGPITEGMIKSEKEYEGSTKSSYVTFRRISEKSDPMSWIHQGVSAKNFAQKAVDNTDVDNLGFLIPLNSIWSKMLIINDFNK